MLFLLAPLLCAGQSSPENDSNVRKIFQAAEQHLWHPESQQYRELYNRLYFYPLQPYLDQRRLLNQMTMANISEIDTFLSKYQGSPLDWPLRNKWLHYLARRHRSALFLKYYQSTDDAELQCFRLRFQLEAGLPASVVLPQATALWRVGKSQPEACNPLFNRWQQAGYRTENVVWQRLKLAADGGKHTLIPYLSSLLPESQRYLGQLWHHVRRDPAYVIKLGSFPHKNEREAEIVLYGLKRLIWRQPAQAIKSYAKARQLFPFTHHQQQIIASRFALALATKGDPLAQQWLDQVDPETMSPKLMQWRLALLLKSQQWAQINAALEHFPDAFKQKLQWQYWYSRSLLELGDKQQGQSMLETLAQKRHYYGFLAASFLEQPINLQNNPVNFSQQEKQQLMENPAAKRAFELFHLQRYTEARREWDYWLSQLHDREKLMAAKIANEQGWVDRAIFTLADVGYLDDVNLRFPLAYDKEISHYAEINAINPAWAFAIARRESSFMTDAHSAAGARGLMQVLPATAKQLERRNITKHYLLNAKNNIRVGTHYLQQLLKKHQGNSVLATAAYNAGPYRVKDWLKGSEKLPADIWIETIPYSETRDYVKSVLAYQQIYQRRVGQQDSVFSDLIDMEISD